MFEAKAVQYSDDEYSSRVHEYHDGLLAAEMWLGTKTTEVEALDCARQQIAELWLFMVQTGE